MVVDSKGNARLLEKVNEDLKGGKLGSYTAREPQFEQ